MFKFVDTKKTYTDPISATFVPGIPLGRDYARGDICLLYEGISSSKVFLNSKALRQAILNSKEYLEEVLNIRIFDQEGKKADKVEEIYMPDDPIIEAESVTVSKKKKS